MTRDLATDANDNLRGVFVTLAEGFHTGECRQFGPLTAAAAGVPVPIFNRVFVFGAPPFDEFSAAVDWMVEREVPFWVTVTEPVVEGVETHLPDLDRDLVKATEQPGMAMAPLDEMPPPDSVAEITEVTDADDLDDFSRVAASVFEIPLDVEKRLDRAALAMDDVRLFLGRVDGDPAACGLLAQRGDVAGVYTIGVVEEFRRRGIGEAMSWEVLRAGRDAGCRVGVLQSSEMATRSTRRWDSRLSSPTTSSNQPPELMAGAKPPSSRSRRRRRVGGGSSLWERRTRIVNTHYAGVGSGEYAHG